MDWPGSLVVFEMAALNEHAEAAEALDSGPHRRLRLGAVGDDQQIVCFANGLGYGVRVAAGTGNKPNFPALTVSPCVACTKSPQVLVVAHLFHPVNPFAVELFLNGDTRSGRDRHGTLLEMSRGP
jgi:hypothetical protein